MSATIAITAAELEQRRARLLAVAAERGLDGVVLFDQHSIRYFANVAFLATERPVALVLGAGGELAVFVPEFEVERVRAETPYERVESYPEYPGREHPLAILARVVRDVCGGGPLGADQDGYPGILGYRGPALSRAAGVDVVPLADEIEQLLVRKSPAEIELIRESGRWCAHAHALLQRYATAGATEAEASLRAGLEATLAMLDAIGPELGQLSSQDGATAGFRGQIGPRSAWAHAIGHNIRFAAGDLLVTETAAPVHGYNAELERGLVVGEPSDRARFLFEHACAAQDVAFAAIRPGATCADVDGAVLAYFEEHGLMPYWRQHVGHAIGLRNHEAPFLDVGDPTTLEPGMVFTVEPGLYEEGVGGVRHSDTVVVTDDGFELLTDYPRDLESLTIPV